MDTNEIEDLFTVVFNFLKIENRRLKIETLTGFVYKISNDKDDRVYIGSTKRDPDMRYSEHIFAVLDKQKTKFYNIVNEINADIKMEILRKFKIRSKLDLELMEDYEIFKHDSINKGLNSKYNTSVAKCIMDKQIKFIDKIGLINDFFYDYVSQTCQYHLSFEHINNIFLNSNFDEKISDSEAQWFIKDNKPILDPLFDDLFYRYNKTYNKFFKVFKYDKEGTELDQNIFSIYAFIWPSLNYKKFVTFSQGGLSNIINYQKYSYEIKLIKEIVKNGLDDLIIIPLEYQYINYDSCIPFEVCRNLSVRCQKISTLLSKEVNLRAFYYKFYENQINISIDNLCTNKYSIPISLEKPEKVASIRCKQTKKPEKVVDIAKNKEIRSKQMKQSRSTQGKRVIRKKNIFIDTNTHSNSENSDSESHYDVYQIQDIVLTKKRNTKLKCDIKKKQNEDANTSLICINNSKTKSSESKELVSIMNSQSIGSDVVKNDLYSKIIRDLFQKQIK